MVREQDVVWPPATATGPERVCHVCLLEEADDPGMGVSFPGSRWGICEEHYRAAVAKSMAWEREWLRGKTVMQWLGSGGPPEWVGEDDDVEELSVMTWLKGGDPTVPVGDGGDWGEG